jgi:hypothetical protein
MGQVKTVSENKNFVCDDLEVFSKASKNRRADVYYYK